MNNGAVIQHDTFPIKWELKQDGARAKFYFITVLTNLDLTPLLHLLQTYGFNQAAGIHVIRLRGSRESTDYSRGARTNENR